MSHSTSAVVSLILAVSIVAGMQAFRTQLASGQVMTILGGFLGSNVFLFLLTFVSNVEMESFGEQFQTKLIPEVVICLLFALLASALVHRVCITVCLLFSIGLLYAVSQISNYRYAPAPTATTANPAKKKK